jgi:hypothetical protein
MLSVRVYIQIIHGAEQSVTEAALETLRNTVAILCPDSVAGFKVTHLVLFWDAFMGPVLAECVNELQVINTCHTNMLCCNLILVSQ